MESSSRRDRFTVLFDIRTIIGVLFAVYGIVCLIWGFVDFSAADSHRAGGINVNLWAGLGMLVVAALFLVWSVAKPFRPPTPTEGTADATEGATDERARTEERAGLTR